MTSREHVSIEENTCCIIPMYNEEQVIESVVKDLKTYFPHVLCVDDGSTDSSADKAISAGATVIRHSINIGQGGALATGFLWVQNQKFDYIVTFDADGQHRPSDALRLVQELHEKKLDVVFASRFLDSNQNQVPKMKKVLLKSVTAITKFLTDVQLTDAHNGLRALTCSSASQIQLTQHGMAHATQFVSLVLQADLRYAEVPVTVLYTPYSRSKGQSILNSINIAFDLIWG
jgi:glycosyltransferase involved in cell wall biosynthesis